jgi:hypothetical protein
VDPRDWSGIPAWLIADRVVSRARNGSVILLHAGPYHTAEALPAIIAGLRARGFGFVTVPQLLGGTGVPVPVPPPPPTAVVKVATVQPSPRGSGRPVAGPASASTRWRHEAALQAGPRPTPLRRIDLGSGALGSGDWGTIGLAVAEQAFFPGLGGVLFGVVWPRAHVPAWGIPIALSTAAVVTGLLGVARTLAQWVHR